MCYSGIMSTDITLEQLKDTISEQNEEIFRLNYLIDSLPGCIYWKDADGRYLGLNKFTLERLQQVGIDLKREDVLQKTDYDIFDHATAEAYRENDEEIMRLGKQMSYEESFRDDGKVIQLSTKTPLKDSHGNIAGIIGNTIDISEKAHMIVELRNAKTLAEQANLAKTSFLRNMEHDIRTPLVGMIGVSKILSEEITNPNSHEMIEDITKCAEQLLDYCNRIFELSKNEDVNTRVEYTPINLTDLAQDIINMFSPAIRKKNLELITTINPSAGQTVSGDHYRLQRILINLVGNAVKFTESGYVKISLSILTVSDTQSLEILVEDSGIGIPADKTDYIFDRFTKVNSSNKGTFPGLGLGLPIVKSFVRDLGGSIQVQSKLDEGTCFQCTIPIPSHEESEDG